MSRESQDAQVAKQAVEQIAYCERKRAERLMDLIDGELSCAHNLINNHCTECEGWVAKE